MALRHAVAERMRLQTTEGQAPSWAKFAVDNDVRSTVHPDALPPLVVKPKLYDADLWFELFIALDFVRLRGSLSMLEDDEGWQELELDLGEAGIGDEQWDVLRTLAHKTIDQCIDGMEIEGQYVPGMQADFEQRYADHPRRRPSTRQAEEDQLDQLFQFLYYPANVGRLDPKEREALANLAKLIGIALPRQSRANPGKNGG